MGKPEVTIAVDEDQLQELTSLVGAHGAPAAVDAAIAAYVVRLRQLNAADEWITQLQEQEANLRWTESDRTC